MKIRLLPLLLSCMLLPGPALGQEAEIPDPGGEYVEEEAVDGQPDEVYVEDGGEDGAYDGTDQPQGPVPAAPTTPQGDGAWRSYAPPPAEPAPPQADQDAGPPIDETTYRQVLDPYGHWEHIPPYGMVWIPDPGVVGAGWRPYTRGHWAYTQHGWTWVSTYSWGWVPFHYGRWHLINSRWVWIPGREWAPAWVSWRQDDEVIGWAPLPYGVAIGTTVEIGPLWWSYVPVAYLGAPVLSHYYIPGHRLYYYHGRTRPLWVVHRHGSWGWYHGPQRTWVERRGGRVVPVVRYRAVPSHYRGPGAPSYHRGHRAPSHYRGGPAAPHRGAPPARYAPGHRSAPGPRAVPARAAQPHRGYQAPATRHAPGYSGHPQRPASQYQVAPSGKSKPASPPRRSGGHGGRGGRSHQR